MSSQIKCYVINLDRSKGRLVRMNSVFNEQGLIFERVKAVDGADINDEKMNHLTSKKRWLYKLTTHEVGCFLSHRECLRQIAAGSEPWGAIFEDDIILSSNTYVFLKNIHWIPEGADIVKLDTGKINCAVKQPVLINMGGVSTHYQLAQLASKHYCAGGYIVSKQCAKKLYELTEYVTAPIDEIYFNPNYGLLRQLNVQQMIPALVVQQGNIESTIEEHRKTMKKKYRPLKLRLQREIQRAYRKHLLLPWLARVRGCRVGKIPFE